MDEPSGRARGGYGRGRGPRKPRATVAERLESGELDEAEARELTREAVLRTLTASQKSRHELSASLSRKGYPEHLSQQVLDRLAEVGLIDDASYAASIVRSRHAERGLSRRAIAMELRRRGITAEVAEDALAQIDDADEAGACEALAARLLARTAGQPSQTRLRKAASALARRGYPPGQAYEVLRRQLEALEAEPPSPYP